MADESYRRAFERKPRFCPCFRAPRETCHGRRRNRGRRTGGRDAGAAARARGSVRRALRGQDVPAREAVRRGDHARRASPCWSASACATPWAGGRSRPSATTASALTAEAGFPPAPDGTAPVVLGAAALAAGSDVAGGGARDARRARVRGGAGRGRRDRGRARDRPARRRRAAARAAWWSAPTASIRPCAARSGSIAAGAATGASACACTTGSRPAAASRPRLEIFVGRGYELYAAPLPDGELLLAALGDRARVRPQRARGDGALDRRAAAAARLARRRDAADEAGRPRAASPAARAPDSRRAPCCWATPRAPPIR